MRNELRFLAEAFTYLADKFENKTKANLRDISEHGLSIESDGFLNVEPNSTYEITVVPRKETKVKKFNLKIESKWVKINKCKMESGFSIVIHSDDEEFKKYIKYLENKECIEVDESDVKSNNRIHGAAITAACRQ